MRPALAIAALLVAAAPMSSLAHGDANWKVVAWERDQDTPDGLRWSTLFDVNSITRAGDLVGYRDAWEMIDDKDRPVQPPGWAPKPKHKINASLRVANCKTREYLHGSAVDSADAMFVFEVKELTTWSPVPTGSFRVVHEFVCGQR